MGGPSEVVETYLADRGVDATRPDEETWVFRYAGDAAKWFVQITVVERFEQVIVSAELPVRVPPPAREGLAVWAARANRGLPVGNFEVDLDAGGVWCKTSIDVEGDELSQSLLENLMGTNMALVERYLAPLQRWLNGDLDSPEAAAFAAEGFEPE